MMMTPLLWRIVLLWLAVVFCCYVGCTDLHQEAQSPVSSKDISSEEEPQENTHHHKVEDRLIVPAPAESENEPPTEDGHVKEEQVPHKVDQNEYAKSSSSRFLLLLTLEVSNCLKEPNPVPLSGNSLDTSIRQRGRADAWNFNQKENNEFVEFENVPLKQNAPNPL